MNTTISQPIPESARILRRYNCMTGAIEVNWIEQQQRRDDNRAAADYLAWLETNNQVLTDKVRTLARRVEILENANNTYRDLLRIMAKTTINVKNQTERQG